nr:ribosomal RNA processing protein 1 homolog isoform X1 [Onthophagus taurus]XP_022907573.1 ribosomal RNA processing protein 1 homolog isoform X2 [Onthophagus taurus]
MQNGKKFTETADFHEYEIRLTQRLQNNNDMLRRKALKEVDKWLKIRMDAGGGSLKPEAFVLWKGLFYALWMADKPLVQEEIAQRISSFVNLSSPTRSIEFFKYGLNILCCEWFGIDQLRLDKFLMFVRRFLRNGLIVIKNAKYDNKLILLFNEALLDTVLNEKLIVKHNCMGLTLHVIEIFLEELAKVSEGKLQPHLVPVFIKPFVEFLAHSSDGRFMSSIKKNIFRYLLEQSNAGQDYQAKFNAWSQLGYPGGSINAMKKIEVPCSENGFNDKDGKNELILDPRAGRVDVILPQIRFKPKQICEMVEQYRFGKGTNSKSRRSIVDILHLFEKMSHGSYPLGIKKVDTPKDDGYSMKLKNAVNRLVKFEKKIKTKKRKLSEEINKDDNLKIKRLKLEKKSTTLKQKPNKPKKESSIIEFNPPNYDFSFERPSGTWYVSNLSESEENDEDKNEKNQLFSETKWDTSNDEKKSPNVIIHSMVVLKNPNPISSTPKSSQKSKQLSSPGVKKVKIDLKLNRSQEIHEHVKQVKSSPGIPFDATRKPSKPLLKTRFTTPIDPFYVSNN